MQSNHLVELNITPFKFKHYKALIEMLKSRGFPTDKIIMKTLPKIGYMVYFGKEPVAAGFLRRVEGGFAQLDGFVSSPFFGSNVRNQGISLVTDTLIQEAKALKLNGVIAFSQDDGISKRIQELPFTILPSIVGIMYLKD